LVGWGGRVGASLRERELPQNPVKARLPISWAPAETLSRGALVRS
jgi:hypothetical protein